jgi:DNA-binding beta-propeller fold protein YncE
MASDEMTDTPAPQAPIESEPVRIASGVAERTRRRKLMLLALLLVVLALLAYTVYYFNANRRLPLPQMAPAAKNAIDPPRYLYSITGTGANALTKPIGVAVGQGNRIYAVDFGRRVIRVFDTGGAFLFAFNTIKDGTNTALRNPVHLAVDASGNVWVTDRLLKSVYVFNPDGKFLRKFVPNGDPAFEWSPFGITVDANGDIYVSDVPSVTVHRIIVFDAAGKLKTMFGRAGQVTDANADPGLFSYPNGVAISGGTGSTRDLFIGDSNNRRVQVFGPDGSFRRIIATEGTPRGIAVDAQKRLYVVDVLSHQIDIFSATGQHLTTFGGNGFSPGQFQYPEGITLDARGRIYVSDRENNQIQVWGFAEAEIPGLTTFERGQVPWCVWFLPLLLLPLLFRKRRFVVTEDFVEGMIAAEMVAKMNNRKWRWIIPEAMYPAFEGRVVEGIDLGELLEPQQYSHSDASALAEKLGIALDRAGLLAMAKRARTLCTEDAELVPLAVLLDIDVYDHASFVGRFIEGRRR